MSKEDKFNLKAKFKTKMHNVLFFFFVFTEPPSVAESLYLTFK